MYKINNFNIVYALLLFMPFVSLLAHRVGSIVSYFAIVFLFILLFFFKSKPQISTKILFYVFLMLLALYVSYMYQYLYYSYNNFYYVQFFGSQVLFFLIFAFFLNVKILIAKYIKPFSIFMIYLIFVSIVIDYFLLKVGMGSSQLMFRPEAYSYHHKPLGIFGQYSISTTYIVFFYMLYLSYETLNKSKKNILFVMVSITVFMQDSGTGYIMYALLLLTILYKSALMRVLLIPTLCVLFIALVQSNLTYKISWGYMIYLYDFFYNIFAEFYMSNIHNVWDFLLGIDGYQNISIDFGPIFMIAKIGFIYFALYLIVILYMIWNVPDRYFRMAVCCLVLGNIHYPTLFYSLMNVLLPILFIYVINLKKSSVIEFYPKKAYKELK